MKMKIIYFIILITFIHSYDYKIIDLESYKYVYYAKDLNQNKDNIIIYKFKPRIEKRNIFLLFLGQSNDGSFEFYLYKNLSDIQCDDNNNYFNYLEKFINYGETKINQELDEYYILVRMNSYEDKYDYLSFMIYNSFEYLDLGNFQQNEEYVFAFQKDNEFVLNYPAKNVTQYLYIYSKGDCDQISYTLYNNNSAEKVIDEIIDNCFEKKYYTLTLLRDNNYYIKIKFQNTLKYKIFRLVLYILTNKKNIKEINDYKTSMKYGYVSSINSRDTSSDYKYFFINTTDLPKDQLMGYCILDPFNSLNYRYFIKRYKNYDINELPEGYKIDKYDYEYWRDIDLEEKPCFFFTRNENDNGFLLKIISYLNIDNDKVNHNEMIIYLEAKIIYTLTENHIFNYTELATKNVFNLEKLEEKIIMKSNLDYFTILYPTRKRIYSKAYLFNISFVILELQNSENAFVEFQYVKKPIINNLFSPYITYLCKNNIQEDKIIFLPYMTNFDILFGDIKVYDIDVSSLNSLDDFYEENYMKQYSSLKRYDNYLSMEGERFFYKLKCNKYSLIKFDDSAKSYTDENLTIDSNSSKLYLDFSRYKQKKININSDLSLSIGILNSPELNESWTLYFHINDEKYSLNNKNDSFSKDFKTNDTLIFEKPNINIHPFVNVLHNYKIEKVRPLSTDISGIFVFEKNISEEYDILINISNVYQYSEIKGKYSLFYGNPNNYEFGQLISYPLEINNNPYKYLENNDENKYFFILYQYYPSYYKEDLHLVKLTRRNIILNELTLLDNNENGNIKFYFPKVNKKIFAFIQFFDKELDVFDEKNNKLKLEFYSYRGKFVEYILNADNEYYASNNKLIIAYKAFFSFSYVDKDNYPSDSAFRRDCSFSLIEINDTYNNINIEIENTCNYSTPYHYYIFIVPNTSNSTNTNGNYYKKTPLELYYENDKKNDSLKYYEFTSKENFFAIFDTFIKGEIKISIVGQETEGFRRFVFDQIKHEYEGKKKSYLVFIIIGCIAGAIIISIIICVIVKHIKRKKDEAYFKESEEKMLRYEPKEIIEKKEIKSADFDYTINGTEDNKDNKDTPDTPGADTPTPI